MAERGFYISLMCLCWQYQSFPSDPWQLSKLLHTRYETTTRWLQKWSHLVATLESDCSRCVVPQVQVCSELLEKNGGRRGTEQNRGDDSRGDYNNVRQSSSYTPSPVPSSVTETDKNNPAPHQESVPPQSESDVQGSAPAAPPALPDIREWSEDAFGVSAERLRNCIVYVLDYRKDDWYRRDGVTPTSMSREKFVRKLNADTPPGWTPAAANAATAPAKTLTPQQIRNREHNARVQAAKKAGLVK